MFEACSFLDLQGAGLASLSTVLRRIDEVLLQSGASVLTQANVPNEIALRLLSA